MLLIQLNQSMTNGLKSCDYTLVTVSNPYNTRYVEVKIPNNIQKGYRTRVKGMGYEEPNGNRGDLFLIVSKIIYLNKNSCENKGYCKCEQRFVLVRDDGFREVNEYLSMGWRVVEFKPFIRKSTDMFYVYVLIEKQS